MVFEKNIANVGDVVPFTVPHCNKCCSTNNNKDSVPLASTFDTRSSENQNQAS